MLELKNIVKIYGEGTALPVKALKGVSLQFKKSEFVSVLGQSGCGKTTMLNIIGGLDRYTEGDLIIDGVSTKDYTDRDWDAYRNHSIGFIFQSYNLIPHQTVRGNVELALTLSGIDKQTRRERAAKALELVGLKDQMDKLPNQLSGGQMQRVAIARAIVNDPEIILADEPTGALDSETSVQVMEILKNLSKDRLVIMVTHNAELAKQYSTRIVTLSDGLIVDDTEKGEGLKEQPKREKPSKVKKPSMSIFTAFALSLRNLLTKKGRTILTAFAGSIGIIGIALILSLSAGFNTYIQNVQRDTLSNYPVTISTETVDYTAMLLGLLGDGSANKGEEFPTEEEITSRDMIENLLYSFKSLSFGRNDLKAFKSYIEQRKNPSIISAIQYTYNLNTQVYGKRDGKIRRVSPVSLPPASTLLPNSNAAFEYIYTSFGDYMNRQGVVSEMIDNTALLQSQYEVLKGSWPNKADEMVLVVNNYNQISDMVLYMLGLMNDSDIAYVFQRLLLVLPGNLGGEGLNEADYTEEQLDQMVQERLAEQGYEQTGRSSKTYSFDQLLSMEYYMTLPSDGFYKTGETAGEDFPLWALMEEQAMLDYIAQKDYPITNGGMKLKISGIVRLKQGVTSGSLSTSLCYTHALTQLLIDKANNSEISLQHINQDRSMLTQDEYRNVLGTGFLTKVEYDALTATLGIIDESTPASIAIYPTSFEAKDAVVKLIDDYNNSPEVQEDTSKQIKYDDYIGLMMSSITEIINAVTYVLIAFVSISLIVSSIMISVITHISVLERTKEIGVLRSIGASKRDISRVFNAETAIIGFTAGILGIVVTLVLNIPISLVIENVSGLKNIATLPVWGGIILVAISTFLTILAGLIPASKASKQDPVIALRSE